MGVFVGVSVGVTACVEVADGVLPTVAMAEADGVTLAGLVKEALAEPIELTVGVLELLEVVLGLAVGDSDTDPYADTVIAGEGEGVVDAGALEDGVALGEAVAAGESDPSNGASTGLAIGFCSAGYSLPRLPVSPLPQQYTVWLLKTAQA